MTDLLVCSASLLHITTPLVKRFKTEHMRRPANDTFTQNCFAAVGHNLLLQFSLFLSWLKGRDFSLNSDASRLFQLQRHIKVQSNTHRIYLGKDRPV